MKRATSSLPDFAGLTAKALDRLGAADFYDRLLDLLSATVTHDLAALVRYSRAAPPDLIIPRIPPTEPMMAYFQTFYTFDPFYRHWKGGGEPGVYRLRSMDAKIASSFYAREFLSAMSISDEIAVKAQGCEFIARGTLAHNFAIDTEIARLQALKARREKVHWCRAPEWENPPL